MADTRADWSRLTAWLRGCTAETVVVSWKVLDGIVGGMPASAIRHYPQWWHGNRSHARAWRAAGFEPIRIRPGEDVTFLRTNVPATPAITPTLTAGPEMRSTDRLVGQSDAARSEPSDRLDRIDPAESLIVIACSARKATGGDARGHPARWSSELRAARALLAGSAGVDERRLMPAWRRYTGGFYTAADDALADAAGRHANIVIISGGYGIATADEPIGRYERVFHLADWPPGLLEDLLCRHAQQTGARSVVAFLAVTTSYARLVRRTPWKAAGITEAVLVSAASAGGGAMVTVPRALGAAFRAFWYRTPHLLPDSITVESL